MRSLFLVVMFVLALPVSAAPLTFGIVPQQSATRLAEVWGPVLSYLSEKTGLELQFATAKDIPTFEKRLLDGGYDFAYMNPYHFVFFNEHVGYRAIAHRSGKGIEGLVVVAKDSPIQSLEELQGKKIAFPSPAAFAASVLPRGELRSSGIEIEPVYVSSHDSVYLNVSKGFFAAGGGIGRTLNNTPAEVQEQLRVLWKTKAYTPHAVASHPRIEMSDHEKLQQALVDMAADPAGVALLESLSIESWMAAQDKDWDDVRALGITLLDEMVK